MKDKLQDLIGYVQDGTNVSLTIFQEDVSPYHYHIYVKQCGTVLWSYSGETLEQAVNNAHHHVVEIQK